MNNYNEEQNELENMNYLRINYQWFFHFERKKRKRERYWKTTCCHSEFDLLKIILFTKKKQTQTEYDDDMDKNNENLLLYKTLNKWIDFIFLL